MEFGSQWDFPHEVDAYGNTVRRLYVYWITLDWRNILVGKIEQTVTPEDVLYRVEYFEEGLNYCLENCKYFTRIFGCPPEKGLVHTYRNRTPVFILARTPDPKRVDLPEILAEVGMKYYDRFEYMRRTKSACVNDRFFVHESPNAFDYKGTFRHIFRK